MPYPEFIFPWREVDKGRYSLRRRWYSFINQDQNKSLYVGSIALLLTVGIVGLSLHGLYSKGNENTENTLTNNDDTEDESVDHHLLFFTMPDQPDIKDLVVELNLNILESFRTIMMNRKINTLTLKRDNDHPSIMELVWKGSPNDVRKTIGYLEEINSSLFILLDRDKHDSHDRQELFEFMQLIRSTLLSLVDSSCIDEWHPLSEYTMDSESPISYRYNSSFFESESPLSNRGVISSNVHSSIGDNDEMHYLSNNDCNGYDTYHYS